MYWLALVSLIVVVWSYFCSYLLQLFTNRYNYISHRGVGGTSYNGLYGEAPPEMGTVFRLQLDERVGISSLVELYERVGKSVIWVRKKAQKSKRCILWLWRSRRRVLVLTVIYSYFIDSAFRAIKRDVKFPTKYVNKGTIFNWEVYERGTFSAKNGI